MKTTAPAWNPKVDAYIAKAQPFAQPILTHVRELAHKACPDVEEEIKWGMPFFLLRGIILANMAGFKQHCSFGFWGPGMQEILGQDGVKSKEAMGSLGRITSLKDLPADKALLGYYRQAAGFVASGERTSSFTRGTKAAKPEPDVPMELSSALKKNKGAAKVFAEFSPTSRREYSEWIVEAKRPETKEKRVAKAVEWIAEGKQRNWKYQNC
ncbi:MAG: hypothetical protein JWQ42_3699 [Edaphobacter sp.]|nr:hypothetical protein [Edaphobacter sp.]